MDMTTNLRAVPVAKSAPRLTANIAEGYVLVKMFDMGYRNVDVTRIEFCDGYVIKGNARDDHGQEVRFDWSVWVETREDGSHYVYGEW